MTLLRRILFFCTGVICITLVVGIAGLLLDPSRAHLWTQSIMWALLGSIAVAPFLVFVPLTSSPESSPEASSPRADREEVDWPAGENDNWPASAEKTRR